MKGGRNSKIMLFYLLVGRAFGFMKFDFARRPANHLRYSTSAYSNLFTPTIKNRHNVARMDVTSFCSRRNLEHSEKAIESPVMPVKIESVESIKLNMKPDFTRQIFCNVELNCENVEAVGFDMDFTLAQYKESFDLLAFEGAKIKLLKQGYPAAVSDFKYDGQAFRRGLIIDKKRGNILQVDRHKYVRKAYHGMTNEITSKERKELYSKQVTDFGEDNFVNIDTLFHPIDAMLFCNLVEMKDKESGLISKSYEEIYKDVRACVDICHRDGVIKDIVMKDPASYIIYDENMVPLLQKLRRAGKKVFLLTNSMWEYTNLVMDFLVHGTGDNRDIEWQSLFDCVVVGACKPGFMIDNYLTMFHVQQNGMLKNIDDNMIIDPAYVQHKAKVFQGGHWGDLHRMLGVSSGDKILYVGDHMYADILRSKRKLGWRTCLIIPELECELEVANRELELENRAKTYRREQVQLDERIDYLRQQHDHGVDVVYELQEAEHAAINIKDNVRRITDEYNSKFNTVWGQMFKAGHQDSRFAKQVMDYACLYTSRASNLAFIYPNRHFRPVQDFMPHDMWEFSHFAQKEDEDDT